MGRNSSGHGTGTGALAEDIMADQVLTYRGGSYVKKDSMTQYLLNERLRVQRAEFEKKFDQLQMKNHKSAII